VFVLGLASLDPALGRDMGDCVRNNLGLVFLNFGLTGRRVRHPNKFRFSMRPWNGKTALSKRGR